jgi:hypothetical protein
MVGRRVVAFFIASAPLSSLASFACSGGGSGGPGATGGTIDGGAEAAPPVVPTATEARQSGRIVDVQSSDPVPGATVTVEGKSATTNAAGQYELLVPRNKPYTMTVTSEGYHKLIEQELVHDKESLARGDTNLLSNQTALLLSAFLTGRKSDKGYIVVKAEPRPPCTSEDGATLAIEPVGEAQLTYFGQQLPDRTRTSVLAGTPISAVFYNVDVGVPLTIKVTSPTCEQQAFPATVGDVTYTGGLRAEAGDVIAYSRVYLQALKTDAGTN